MQSKLFYLYAQLLTNNNVNILINKKEIKGNNFETDNAILSYLSFMRNNIPINHLCSIMEF